MKYVFPAIFRFDRTDEAFPEGVWLVEFPDLPACCTFGASPEEAFAMASDVLSLALMSMEDRGETIPAPMPLAEVFRAHGEAASVSLVAVDTLEYRKKYDTRSVKKTLSIPSWMDSMARARHVNFSQVLQRALLQELTTRA